MATPEVQSVLNDIQEYTQETVEFLGGGKGQIARVLADDGSHTSVRVYEGRGTSRLAAVKALLAALQEVQADSGYLEVVPVTAKVKPSKPKPNGEDRPTVEDALEVLAKLFGEFDVLEEDDDRTPGPVWKGTTLVRIVPCVGECMAALPTSPCDCRCGGSNHAIGGAFMFPILTAAVKSQDKGLFGKALQEARPVVLGPKECLCGCGGITQRRFVPGHDARYHAALKRAAAQAEAGGSAQA